MPLEPYYADDWVTLYHGDSREVVPSLDADALITDPPYGIGWTRGPWNDDPEAYPELMAWLVAQGHRLGGWCFVFQSMQNVSRFHEWFPDGWRIFAACKNFAQVTKQGAWRAWDPVVFWNSGPNSGPNSDIVNRDYHVGNVAGVMRRPAGHPCPRPLDTMRHIIAIATTPGQTVLDPFVGSGTTLRAAKDLNRRAVGVEIEEEFCELAASRLAQDVLEVA